MEFTIHWTMVAVLLGLGWVAGVMSVIAFCYWADRWLWHGLEDSDPLKYDGR